MLKIPAGQLNLPEGLSVALPTDGTGVGPEGQVLPEVLYTGVVGWYHIHGMLMLELFGHTRDLISDTGTFYKHEVDGLLQRLGLH